MSLVAGDVTYRKLRDARLAIAAEVLIRLDAGIFIF
jgi:hypothetical protein